MFLAKFVTVDINDSMLLSQLSKLNYDREWPVAGECIAVVFKELPGENDPL